MERDMTKHEHETFDCTDLKALLSAYIDDEIDAQTRHRAERHLAECADCRALVNEAEGLDGLVALDAEVRENAVQISPEFEANVLVRTAYARSPRAPRWGLWSGWMAAAACLTLAGVIWITDRGPTGEFIAHGGEQDRRTPSAIQPTVRAAVDPAAHAYTTGLDLRSQTHEGAFPADMFRLAGHVRPMNLALPTFSSLAREDSETLYTAALLLDFLSDIDPADSAEVQWIRQAMEVDELLSRLPVVRDRVHDAARPAVFAAESILMRMAHDPLASDDVRSMRDTVNSLNLAREINRLSERSPDTPTL